MARSSLLPATDMSVQGEPNVTISTGSASAPSTREISPRCFTKGSRFVERGGEKIAYSALVKEVEDG